MSLKLVPSSGHATTTSTKVLAPSAPVHDTLRAGLTNEASAINNRHPLEQRLQEWETTQQELRLESMRRVFGMGEPIRRGMELFHCNEGVRHTGFQMEDGIGADILRGTDTKIDVDDVWRTREFGRGAEYAEVMEQRMRRGL